MFAVQENSNTIWGEIRSKASKTLQSIFFFFFWKVVVNILLGYIMLQTQNKVAFICSCFSAPLMNLSPILNLLIALFFVTPAKCPSFFASELLTLSAASCWARRSRLWTRVTRVQRLSRMTSVSLTLTLSPLSSMISSLQVNRGHSPGAQGHRFNNASDILTFPQ